MLGKGETPRTEPNRKMVNYKEGKEEQGQAAFAKLREYSGDENEIFEQVMKVYDALDQSEFDSIDSANVKYARDFLTERRDEAKRKALEIMESFEKKEKNVKEDDVKEEKNFKSDMSKISDYSNSVLCWDED